MYKYSLVWWFLYMYIASKVNLVTRFEGKRSGMIDYSIQLYSDWSVGWVNWLLLKGGKCLSPPRSVLSLSARSRSARSRSLSSRDRLMSSSLMGPLLRFRTPFGLTRGLMGWWRLAGFRESWLSSKLFSFRLQQNTKKDKTRTFLLLTRMK